ncbi:MAG: hypothetical protein WAT29_01545 [Thiolinea sp.]
MSLVNYKKVVDKIRQLYYLLFPKRSLRNLAVKSFIALKFISSMALIIFMIGVGALTLYTMALYKPVNFKAYPDEKLASNEYIEIQKIKDTLILVENKKCDAYRIVLRDSKILYEQPFDLQKYTRNNIEAKTRDSQVIDTVCKNLGRLNNGIPLHLLLANEDNDYIKALSAIGAILYEASSKASELHIFVKGYADKSKGDWQRKLDKKYAYGEIDYYTSLSPDKKLYYINPNNLITHFVPHNPNVPSGYYTNDDLPFLRAKYVLENHIINNLSYCFPTIKTIGVLEGEILEKEQPDLRNTEVYVTACY